MSEPKTPTEVELRHERALTKYPVPLFTEELLVRVYTQETHQRWQAFDTLDELMAAVERVLLRPEQIAWLALHKMTLAELMGGGFPADMLDEVNLVFCEDWNAQIGVPVFGFKPSPVSS